MREKRRREVLLPLLISMLIHLLAFAAVSLDAIWPLKVSASRPPRFRIVSVDLPKPAEEVAPAPDARILSDADRRASGAERPSPTPRLREEAEERIPARRGGEGPQIAALPPAPPVQAAPPSPPAPEVPPVQAVPPAPPAPQAPPAPEPRAETSASSVEPPKREPPKAAPPRPEGPRPEGPREQAKVELPEPAKKPEKKEEAKREEPKPPQVAALPRPRPAEQARPPQPPADPLAMFRAEPQRRGRPDAPKLDISDEEADRIARAGLQRDLKREEEGEAVSLDTRDFRYASYFAHIKQKIQNAWIWPYEARNYQGRLVLRFVLAEDGTLRKVELLSSSGYRILDDEAMSAVTKAAPFRPFPPGFDRKLLPIEGTFIYERAGVFYSR